MRELGSLLEAIKKGVREEAAKHPIFGKTNGCIRVTMTPKNEEADTWMGGHSSFGTRAHVGFGCVTTSEPDIMTYEFAAAIIPGQGYGTFFEYPSSMSKTVSFTIVEHEGEDVSEFCFIQVCISGARDIKADTALASSAGEAVADWFRAEKSFEVVPTI